ncbi:MAG: hypothetical protein JSC189_000574 [Candidatus Tokpelaia sp. JSC189]|nr:MAG: hypothetical protein JSC189_000574 [Candidatus Tokpelaia sp. JSC189]
MTIYSGSYEFISSISIPFGVYSNWYSIAVLGAIFGNAAGNLVVSSANIWLVC